LEKEADPAKIEEIESRGDHEMDGMKRAGFPASFQGTG
jgi:hypothetical protein